MAEKKTKSQHVASNGGAGGAYFLGMVGAAWYYVSVANGLGEVFVGLLKALVWPAFLVYELLKSVAA